VTKGISKTGKQVEAEFRRITGATKPTHAKLGDAVIDGWNIEVKKTSSNTLNQVRAVKFIPLVVKDTRSNQWYVVPAPDIIRLVVVKKRGQHTENPFESSTLNISALKKFQVRRSDLLLKTRSAISKGKRHPKLQAEMNKVLNESRALADKSRKRVCALL
jgi:hypothetical protein